MALAVEVKVDDPTIDTANVVVEVDLSVLQISIAVAKAGPQDVAIINADIFSRVLESHGDVVKLKRVV